MTLSVLVLLNFLEFIEMLPVFSRGFSNFIVSEVFVFVKLSNF